MFNKNDQRTQTIYRSSLWFLLVLAVYPFVAANEVESKVRHYALTNHKEYFAEGTEAYFYRNDFYPFVRAELKEHDPELHELLVEIWGSLQ